MRTQDICIGETYKHRHSPQIGFAKAVEIIRPRPQNDKFASLEAKSVKVVVVKCQWSTSKDCNCWITKHFRPCDLVKL